MTPLAIISTLRDASPEVLHEQLLLRHQVLDALLNAAVGAPSPLALLSALEQLAPRLDELQLFDNAARLRALARAVAGDVRRLDTEAQQLEQRLGLSRERHVRAPPSQEPLPLP